MPSRVRRGQPMPEYGSGGLSLHGGMVRVRVYARMFRLRIFYPLCLAVIWNFLCILAGEGTAAAVV